MEDKSLFTSESVFIGHPDKMADQISDAVLDALIEQDPDSRVACETLVKTGLALVTGEITSKAIIDYQKITRDTIRSIGYTDSKMGIDADTCAVLLFVEKQSPDISQGVTAGEGLHTEQGAGDQGMMFGFACNETPELMPLPVLLSHKLSKKTTDLRESRELPYLLPDGKCQVTIEYEGSKPVRAHTIVLSTQHIEDVEHAVLKKDIIEKVVKPTAGEWIDDNTIYHINPTGKFVCGGPLADCGLTGRHGGGAFSGKDPSKVDRSAAYAARYLAKNIVAAGIADECELQLSYAIGVADPLSININTFGTGKKSDKDIIKLIRDNFDLKPAGIIKMLDLKRPIYRKTAMYGHFGGSPELFPWEKTDRAESLGR